MNAYGWNCAGGEGAILRGTTSSELEQDAERKSCNAYRVAVDGGAEIFRKLAGQWVCTSSH